MWQESYLERFYPHSSWRRDGTTDFYALMKKYCSGKILEVGAGPSNPTSDYLKTLGEIHGVDIDPSVLDNEALQSAAVIQDAFPFPDQSFDSCISNYVCEHLTDPVQHLKEIYRVLRPAGFYIFRTPNRFHYVAMISSLTPYWFHLKVANRLRGVCGHDPYPTQYRLNSRRKIIKLARESGFTIEYLRLVEKEPSYGMGSRILFLLFMAYERIVNCSELFAGFRSNLFVVLRKR
jgi:SAM-dependent methyltransferase